LIFQGLALSAVLVVVDPLATGSALFASCFVDYHVVCHGKDHVTDLESGPAVGAVVLVDEHLEHFFL